MLLKEIVDELTALRIEGSLDREVAGITYDSRRISPGMVFVAIPGQNTDGHDFIPAAIDRGAAAIICERNGFTSQKAAKIKVADTREALARASAAFYGHPSAKLKVIGVTGTNGKTTVSFMVKRILEAAGIKTGLLGTIRYEIGDRVIPAHRTTPEALEVQYLMSQMLRAGCQACVMEVSSHALDQKRVAGVEFDVGVFTNLTQDHLDYHGTMENYFTAKSHLFDRWPDGSKPGAAIINIDDVYGLRLAESTNAEIRLTYGVNGRAHLRATKIHLGRDQTRFHVETDEKTIACHLPLIGTHNIYNALAAAGTGLALKVSPQHIQAGLNAIKAVPGRLEGILCGQPFGVFVDYAHTDDALQNVLKTLREITPGRLIVAFGCGGSRDTGKRAKMGAVAARMADATIITSDNPRKEQPAGIATQIEEGYRSARTDGYDVELDRERAIDQAIRMAKEGDTVLIAGKGHETYQEFEDTVVPFDDCVIARETLEKMGHKKK